MFFVCVCVYVYLYMHLHFTFNVTSPFGTFRLCVSKCWCSGAQRCVGIQWQG